MRISDWSRRVLFRSGDRPLVFAPFALVLARCLAMRAAVATDTVFDVGYPFLAVLGDDFCRLMLMASVAGVLLVIVIQVTGRAGCIVIAVEQEITAVVECCRLPVPWLVTRSTGKGLAAMQVIARSHVTGLAVRARVGEIGRASCRESVYQYGEI